MHGIRGEAAPTVEGIEVQPKHTGILAPASRGSGAAKAPVQRLTCLSLLPPARPGTGLVMLSLR